MNVLPGYLFGCRIVFFKKITGFVFSYNKPADKIQHLCVDDDADYEAQNHKGIIQKPGVNEQKHYKNYHHRKQQ